MTSKTLNIALIQQACVAEKEANLDKSIRRIKKAAAAGAELIVLQELHSSLYFCQTEDVDLFNLAEEIPGATSQRLEILAKELNIVLVASLFEKRATGLYHNTAVVFDKQDGMVGTYRKMHIPDDPGFYEKFYFTPGDAENASDVFQPIKTSVGNLGLLVCWDQWYPEAARLMAMAGADLLIYPTAIGWDMRDDEAERKRQRDAWVTIQRAHAVANGLPVLVCNRTGHESDPSGQSEGINFWGTSFIAGPQGELLAKAAVDEEAILIGKVDLSRSEDVRRIWPFLRDRRVDAYAELTKRFRD